MNLYVVNAVTVYRQLFCISSLLTKYTTISKLNSPYWYNQHIVKSNLQILIDFSQLILFWELVLVVFQFSLLINHYQSLNLMFDLLSHP